MDTKRDIQTREDINLFIDDFYDLVRADETIGFIFNDVIKMDWEHHIPLIVDFWETILLDNPVYQKNAMESHFHVNKEVPLKRNILMHGLKTSVLPLTKTLKAKYVSLQRQEQNQLPGLCYLK